MSMVEPAVVVQKAYEWNLWVIPKAEKFPRSYRFTLGERLVGSSLALLLHLVDASYQARNAASLGAAAREVIPRTETGTGQPQAGAAFYTRNAAAG
jgi:hypothetical protein